MASKLVRWLTPLGLVMACALPKSPVPVTGVTSAPDLGSLQENDAEVDLAAEADLADPDTHDAVSADLEPPDAESPIADAPEPDPDAGDLPDTAPTEFGGAQIALFASLTLTTLPAQLPAETTTVLAGIDRTLLARGAAFNPGLVPGHPHALRKLLV